MTLRYWMRSFVCALAALALAPSVLAQPAANTPNPDHPGKAVYDRVCAACHNNPGTTRAATFSQLTGTAPAQLRAVLTEGVMKPMAASLSPEELGAVVGYLASGQPAINADWTDALICAADNRAVDTGKPVAFGGFGVDLRSTRNLTAKQAGLTKAQMGDLEVAWAVGFPLTQSLGTGAAVLGDTLFVNGGGKLLALDAARGCARWAKTSTSRNTPQIADIGGRKVLVMVGGRGDVQVISARTGDLVWTANGLPSSGVGTVRGAVAVYRNMIIVPISASGVGAAANPRFECCTGHGAVVALSATDGRKLWEYNTMGEATYNGQVSSTGVKQRGPSGAPIWSVPTIDEKRGRVIVATGENTSHPGTDTSDAIIAIDLATGKEVWKFQAMKADVWNMSCNDRDLSRSGPNCPNLYDAGKAGRDFDFGATPMLLKGAGGKDIIVNGQKSGDVWAVDAATGKLIWNQRRGEGTALGGVHWGVASDGQLAFAPISDPGFSLAEQDRKKAGVYAFRLSDGKEAWAHLAAADCPPARKPAIVACQTKFGFSAAPIVIDGAVVAGTLDGKLVVLDGKTGAVLRTTDTVVPFKTVNGIAGRGGSIDSHAISAGAGHVFVTSGYGAFGQTPGNVLIAFRPKAK